MKGIVLNNILFSMFQLFRHFLVCQCNLIAIKTNSSFLQTTTSPPPHTEQKPVSSSVQPGRFFPSRPVNRLPEENSIGERRSAEVSLDEAGWVELSWVVSCELCFWLFHFWPLKGGVQRSSDTVYGRCHVFYDPYDMNLYAILVGS